LLAIMTSLKGRSFLVVAHDRVATSAFRVLSLYRCTRIVRPGEAHRWLDAVPPLLGIVLEAAPTIDDALDVLAKLRVRYPYAPAVLLADALTASNVEQSYRLRASLLPSQTDEDGLLPFVFRCLTEEAVCDDRVGCLVESLVRGGLVTAREAELLVLVLADIPREEIASRMCITENTVKAHTRQLLRKLDATDLDKLAARIFRVALQSGSRRSWIPSGSGERPAVYALTAESGTHAVAERDDKVVDLNTGRPRAAKS
jgi:DNA-binding NarL/FixJ family response regulator